MKVFGLTGGVGMGKSAAADLLAGRGVAVADTDVIARQIVEPGQPALSEISVAFGSGIIAPDGRLRRDELAEMVFRDDTARGRLEAILHPRIRATWTQQIESWRAENRAIAAVVIPLLFETNAASSFDATICVACSAGTQEERLRLRGWTWPQMEQRRRAQWPINRKMDRADYVVWSEGSFSLLAEQLGRIVG